MADIQFKSSELYAGEAIEGQIPASLEKRDLSNLRLVVKENSGDSDDHAVASLSMQKGLTVNEKGKLNFTIPENATKKFDSKEKTLYYELKIGKEVLKNGSFEIQPKNKK